MKIIKKASTISDHVAQLKKQKKKIGFVPTMGALHDGHMSLVEASVKKNDITIVSVFVNPTQFNDKSDLDKYPRTLDADAKLLKEHGCNYVFAPKASQIYPKDVDTDVKIDISQLTALMEGPNRPGHFEGVVQVVHRLLDIVKPHKLYMGQKDFQQFTIIQYMLKTLKMKTKLVVCPIIREESGLAMSSRNVRLKPVIRKKTPLIFETLQFAKDNIKKRSIKYIQEEALKRLKVRHFKTEYFEIVDGNTLEKVSSAKKHDYVVACTAVWAGDVRLIDNMILKKD